MSRSSFCTSSSIAAWISFRTQPDASDASESRATKTRHAPSPRSTASSHGSPGAMLSGATHTSTPGPRSAATRSASWCSAWKLWLMNTPEREPDCGSLAEQRRDRSVRGGFGDERRPRTSDPQHSDRQTDRDTDRQQRPAWFGWRRANVARGRREPTGRGRRPAAIRAARPRVRAPSRGRSRHRHRDDDPASGGPPRRPFGGRVGEAAIQERERRRRSPGSPLPAPSSTRLDSARPARRATAVAIGMSAGRCGTGAVVEASSNESVPRDQSSSPATRRTSKASGDRSPVHSIRRASTCGDVAALGEATRIAADAARCSSTTAPPVASNVSTTG